jgi:hypothetical protein
VGGSYVFETVPFERYVPQFTALADKGDKGVRGTKEKKKWE